MQVVEVVQLALEQLQVQEDQEEEVLELPVVQE
jgi:hypothetical protein